MDTGECAADIPQPGGGRLVVAAAVTIAQTGTAASADVLEPGAEARWIEVAAPCSASS